MEKYFGEINRASFQCEKLLNWRSRFAISKIVLLMYSALNFFDKRHLTLRNLFYIIIKDE